METRTIYKRIHEAMEAQKRNEEVRQLLHNAGCSDFDRVNRSAMIRSARFGLLEYALQLHHKEQRGMALDRFKQSIREAFGVTNNKMRA